MAEFLSVEWIAALDAAARRSQRLAACATEEPFVLEVRVAGPDGGEAVHQLLLRADGVRVVPGEAAPADVVLRAALPTAADLSRGRIDAQRALANGGLRLRGDVEALTRRAEALRAVDDVFAAVRAETTYPAELTEPGAPPLPDDR